MLIVFGLLSCLKTAADTYEGGLLQLTTELVTAASPNNLKSSCMWSEMAAKNSRSLIPFLNLQ